MLVILIDPDQHTYMFLETIVLMRKCALRGPEWSKSSKFGQHLLLAVRKPAKISKQITHKDMPKINLDNLRKKVKIAEKILSKRVY